MKKKNDKVIIMLIVILVYTIMSWIMSGGLYKSGVFTPQGYTRVGLYDIVSITLAAFNYRIWDIFYILVIGGFYGVLQNEKHYRKLVDKTSALVKKHPNISFAVVTFIVAAYTSISNQLFVLFAFVPFIISVFLRAGERRITAVSAAFGGMFVGYLGLTFGTYGVSELHRLTNLDVHEWIWAKVVLFFIAYGLFNAFSILYMNKHKKGDDTKYDMFCPEKLDERDIKSKRKRTKIWPIIIPLVLAVITLMLGYIDWYDSFGVSVFDDIFISLTTGFKIGDVKVFGALLGQYITAFGNWENFGCGSMVVLVTTGIIALIGKVGINQLVTDFGSGVKRISKVAFIYGIASVVVFFATTYPWPYTIIDYLFGNGGANFIIVILIGIIAQILLGDPLCFFLMGKYFTLAFTETLVSTAIAWRVSSAIAMIIGPTSFLLLAALTYLDIPYVKWMKYIWKFVLSFALITLLLFAIVIYV